jgi:hypothetical protein
MTRKPEKSCCWRCKWLGDRYNWICTNAASEDCADSPPMYAGKFVCPQFEEMAGKGEGEG